METISKDQHEALKIYKEISELQRETVKKMRKAGFYDDLDKSIAELIASHKVSPRTAEILKNYLVHPSLDKALDQVEAISLSMFDKILAGKGIDGKINLRLYKNGVLGYNPIDNRRYVMNKEKMRIEILKVLANEQLKAQEISDILNSTPGSIRKAIESINKNSSLFLEIDDKLIESDNKLGYFLNEKYYLILD
ncbi:MAG: hypothetical protein PHR00_03870 [Patescibacteria group bacterium]|nr:hypothetical protein [Patescibacteria group bacterium]